jgi:uncharacterized membrane protein
MDIFFWIFDLLLPVIILLMGVVFTLRPPKRIQMLYGYRTQRSMASQRAWDEAHRYSGRIYIRIAPALLVFVIAIKLLVPLAPEVLSLALLPFSFAALIVPIPFTERRLKQLAHEEDSEKRG